MFSTKPDIAKFVHTLPRFYAQRSWDREALWALDARITHVWLGELAWHLDLPVWSRTPGGISDLTANEVLARLEEFPDHHRQIMAVDISYPIELLWYEQTWVVLDGIHRLARLALEGTSTLAVRQHPTEILALIHGQIA